LDFHDHNQLEGYRRLTFMMLEQDVIAVTPSLGLPGAQGRWQA
jgi:putative transposase